MGRLQIRRRPLLMLLCIYAVARVLDGNDMHLQHGSQEVQ